MRVALRVDSSSDVASGHLIRCLALATALSDKGANCTFIARNHHGNLNHRVTDAGFALRSMDVHPVDDPEFVSRLGATVSRDAAETAEFLSDIEPDWLVIDHYSLNESWESLVRVGGMRILVIDDLANRRHDCDALLDQNFPADTSQRYSGLVPPGSALMLGPRYALLNPEFAVQRAHLAAHPERLRDRILVTFGAGDPDNLTEMSLEALSAPSLRGIPADIVMGSDSARAESIRRLSARRPGTRVHGPQPNLALLMAATRASIGAGGTTVWERLSMGIPSVVVSMAPNQELVCRTLAGLRLIHYIGSSETVSPALIARACEAALQDPPPLVIDGATGDYQVDGMGATRVAKFMVAVPPGDAPDP